VQAKRHRRHHRHRVELEFLVNAGNVSCSQSAQTKVDLAYIQPDHLDTPRTVTDSTQKVIWQWDNQDPFGANAANEDPDGDGQRFSLNLRFPGQYFDSETGLHYNYFRDYDPSTGRYIQSDPVGLVGGINTYAYAQANPGGLADPSGETPPVPVPQVAVGTAAFLFGKAVAEGIGAAVDIGLQVQFVAERNEQKQVLADACSHGVPGACDAASQMEEQTINEEISDVGKKGVEVIKNVYDIQKKAKDLIDPKKWKPRNWGSGIWGRSSSTLLPNACTK